jgi:hypothetical protein
MLRRGTATGTDQGDSVAPLGGPVKLRLADRCDRRALERLAQLDSRSLPPGPHLVAIRGEAIAAALSLTTGEVVADPFQRTLELVALLRLHAGSRRVARGEPARTPRTLPRLVTT